jgi:hypothetical protein
MKIPIFWDKTPCSPLKVCRHFRGTCHLLLQGQRISWARNQHKTHSKQGQEPEKQALVSACFMLVSCLAYSLALKMEVTCSSGMSADFQWTTQCYMSKDRTLNNILGCSSSHYYIGHKYTCSCQWNDYSNIRTAIQCLLLMCISRLLLCLVRCGQYGHWSWGSLPHSSLKCLNMLFLYW